MLNTLLVLAFVLPWAAVALNHYRPWIRTPFLNQTSLSAAQVQECWDYARRKVAIDHGNPKAATMVARDVMITEEPAPFKVNGELANGCTNFRWYAPWKITVVRQCAYAALQYEMENLALKMAGYSVAGR